MNPLQDRHIVLCVTGSIAAYKAADLASKLVQAGARVEVVLTREACEFVMPFTFRALTGHEAYTDMFRPVSDKPEEHIALARGADLVVIAPASATTMARIAHGLADDLVSLTVLATRAPVLVAPAMDSQMWLAAATQANVETLKARGVSFAGPATGRLASGHTGPGRLAEVEEIIGAARWLLGKQGDLAGKHIVVSAGGTREPIDPVRYISNHSSGKMGYALAEAARDRGARVTLVSTMSSSLATPYGVELAPVATVAEMREAVLAAAAGAHAVIMAAAVSDYRPAQAGEQKLKKHEGDSMTLELVQNADFFHEVPDGVIKVAFAAETENLIENARRKPLSHGRLDLICANDVSAAGSGFGADTNKVTIIDAHDTVEELPLMAKYDVAWRILDRVSELLSPRPV